MIKVENYTKIYKLNKKKAKEFKSKEKIAVDNISFEANKGNIFGLLGPNGAGKTTTLRAIATLLKPTEGNIIVGGYDTVKQAEKVRAKIGFLTNELKLDKHFTPKYTFEFFGKLYGISDEDIIKRRNELFEYFDITKFQDKKISELSTGMTQKLAIATSLVHNPEVIIFDEPTSGLDIITAKKVIEYLIKLKNEGKLVIISTHIMSVAEKLCDNIGIIINGKIVAKGTIKKIKEQTDTEDLENAFYKLYENNMEEE